MKNALAKDAAATPKLIDIERAVVHASVGKLRAVGESAQPLERVVFAVELALAGLSPRCATRAVFFGCLRRPLATVRMENATAAARPSRMREPESTKSRSACGERFENAVLPPNRIALRPVLSGSRKSRGHA